MGIEQVTVTSDGNVANLTQRLLGAGIIKQEDDHISRLNLIRINNYNYLVESSEENGTLRCKLTPVKVIDRAALNGVWYESLGLRVEKITDEFRRMDMMTRLTGYFRSNLQGVILGYVSGKP